MLRLQLLAAPNYRYDHKQKQENELFHRFVLSLALLRELLLLRLRRFLDSQAT
jgi:hypothetical protein